MDVYLAAIFIFGGNFNPRGFEFCQGQLLPISQNAALFSLLSTVYGGNGQTTFALPDLRGRSPIGAGQGPGLPDYIIGQFAGTPNVTLTLGNLPAHTHTATLSSMTVAPSASTAAATTNVPGPNLVPAKLPSVGSGPSAIAVNGYAPQDNTTTLAPASVNGTATIGITGQNIPVNIQDPYLVVNYIIATEGIYPSRN